MPLSQKLWNVKITNISKNDFPLVLQQSINIWILTLFDNICSQQNYLESNTLAFEVSFLKNPRIITVSSCWKGLSADPLSIIQITHYCKKLYKQLWNVPTEIFFWKFYIILWISWIIIVVITNEIYKCWNIRCISGFKTLENDKD